MTRHPPPNGDSETGPSTGTGAHTDSDGGEPRHRHRRRREWLVLAVVGCLAITAVAGGLAVGAADASSSASEKQVDIVFVVDSSESMDPVRYELARDIGVLRKQLEGEGIDARYGLVTYGRTATVRQQLTGDYGEFDRAMNFETGGNVENASRAILTATQMDFRPNAERVIVLVTNEDDDSSPSVRQKAFAALSKTHFITVSHDTAGMSSCRIHSEPCDNRTANEPTRMARAVGGDWLDVTNSRAAILEEIGEIVTAEILDLPSAKAGEEGGNSSDTSSESRSPNVEVQSITANESSIEVGEAVTLTVELANSGPVPGEFEAYVHLKDSPDDFGFSVVGTRSVKVPAEGTRAVTFTTTFDSAGDYYVYTSGTGTTVSVVERKPTTVQTTVNDTTVTASVSEPEPGESVDITFERVPLGISDTDGDVSNEGGASGDESGATTNASVQSGREEAVGTLNLIRVTPTTERDFTVTVTRRHVGQNGTLGLGNETAPLPAAVEPISVLSLDSSGSDSAFETATLEYTVASETTRLYRYDAATRSWKPVEITSVNRSTAGESRRVVAQTDGSTLFAVVEAKPVFEILNASVETEQVTAGEQLQTVVTVQNTGLANGSYTAELTVDGDVVATATVRVSANATETVVFTYRPQTAGEYTVSVNGRVAGTLTVESAESDGGESGGTANSQTGTATATQTSTATPTATATATATESATPTASEPTEETDSAGEEADPTATATESTTAPAATDSPSGGSTTGSAPGFTPISLAVAVFVLSVLSLWRRR